MQENVILMTTEVQVTTGGGRRGMPGSLCLEPRMWMFNYKVGIDGEQDVIQRAMSAPRKKNWAIVLLGGGHFAAAIYRGKEVIIHKTFHNYTVRAKQGGSQGTKDSQSGTVHPKSSGASLRRYNEQSQQQGKACGKDNRKSKRKMTT
ncbi:Ankyrin repeat and zinc finger domain-containing protein 1 [Portunus trituberculatus]|uniref:Ankyrin repeat and zinc finger domain-containing protein 1 n=1 Tax=Portunus trituberculatus TaxID=210409 RepID=A0A5B7F658_PORTR|nr:Ankyrin repeat and zinc finger domain-containing protein 1 [Portunus trituberculatus]